jgi:hypothetical protein
MGTTTSSPVKIENKNARPGYYFTLGKVMYKGQLIPLLPDEKEFQKLKYGYLKSNLRVFYNGTYIPDANPVTFSVLTRKNTKTLSKFPKKNQEFTKLNCVLGMDFVCDKKRIYYRNNIIHEE